MTTEDRTATLSLLGDEPTLQGAGPRPHLFLLLESHRPTAPSARFDLGDLALVVVGRGDARRALRAAGKRLTVQVEDRWMSGEHARFTYAWRRWVLEDAGSKNGSIVNGVPTTRAELKDGDIIELGRTFFLFRDAVPCEAGDPEILDTTSLEPAGLATLSPSLRRAFAQLALIARSTISVVIQGETGTGKEVLSRALHALSGRPGALVAVNCGALPATLVESELFGHKKGAFSGATEDRPGLVRSADQGTLLLDEIGDLPLPSQAALLRVLEDREVRAIGSNRAVPVDFRLIAATHRPLSRLVELGAFRADLFARISGHRIELPPLRDRREDLGLLAGALLARHAPGKAPAIHPRAVRALLAYPFPGNVRELEKALGTALVLAGAGPIEREHLPEAIRSFATELEAEREPDEDGRREKIVALLREHDGNIAAVARAMGKARMQVQRWLKRYEIDPAGFRPR